MMTENSSQENVSSGTTSSDNSQSTQSSGAENTQSAASQNADATANPAQTSISAPETDASGNAVTPAPVYQPNFKFKAFGKEHEIEEMFRSLVKDKDTEEKVRKFHEKAYAMEKFQENEKKTKADFEAYRTQSDPNLKAMGHFNNLLKNKDWDNFFGGLKIPDEELFNYVEKKLALRQMPPEQRAEIERQNQVRQQNYAYENQLTQVQKDYEDLSIQTRSMQLDNFLAKPEVVSQAELIDKAYGEPGSFRNLVLEEAANHFFLTEKQYGKGVDMTVEQAVQRTIQKYGRLLQAQNPAAGMPQTQGSTAAAQPQATAQAPIIPHVSGSARSPVKKSPRSLDDVKKLAREAQAREAQQNN